MKALLSVYNKTGLIEFADFLTAHGWELISTGGTYKVLAEAGIAVEKISDYTSAEEILDGRVKVLNEKIFAGILARSDHQKELDNLKFPRIDLVCCNFYPFQKLLKQQSEEELLIENIDIGGVSMVRAAAKNYKNVLVVTDPEDYSGIVDIIQSGEITQKDRKILAAKAFKTTSQYEKSISDYFSGIDSEDLQLSLTKVSDLRYGENSHQWASFYGEMPFEKIQGDVELSFNNIQDAVAAQSLLKELPVQSALIVKHLVPCGAASADSLEKAYDRALESDPMSAFGGILALTSSPSVDLAQKIIEHFYEVIIAPDYSPEILTILSSKPRLRVLKTVNANNLKDIRSMASGILVQDLDNFDDEEFTVVTANSPSEIEISDLKFAWRIVAFLKSNAIAIVKDKQTLGLGSGETSRVGAVELAAKKVKQFFGSELGGAVLASDAFFPFPDAIEEAAKLNIKAIIQPGGSKNDQLVIDAADKHGISMVFTGRRHFLH